MPVKTFNTRIKLKQDTNAHWVNPGGNPIGQDNPGLILLNGELGFDTTNSNFKIGDGSSRWDQLKYIIGSAIIADYTALPAGVTLGNPIANTDTLNVALAKLQSQVSSAASAGVTSIDNHIGAFQTSGYIITESVPAEGQNPAFTAIALDSNSIDHNYNEGGQYYYNHLATVDTVMHALGTLDVPSTGTGAITGFGAGKTLATLTETDGKIAATFQDISITASQISDGSSTFQAKFTDGSHNVLTISDAPSGTTTYAKKLEFFDGTQTGGALGTASTASDTLYISKAVSTTNPIITKDDISGITGAMVYQGTLGTGGTITSLPEASTSNKGWVYVVSVAGTYASKDADIGDMFVSNGSSWDLIQGTVKVTNSGPTIVAGASDSSTIATIEGTSITAKVSVTAGSATIASKTGNVVTIKTGVTQSGTSGTIGNDTGTDIVLDDVAITGAANELSVTSATYGGATATTNAQTALTNLATAISNAAITIDTYKGSIRTGDGLTHVQNDGGSFGLNLDSTDANGLYLKGESAGSKTLAMYLASASQFGTVKVTSGNGLSISSGVITYSHAGGSATIASVANDIVTLKAGISQASGTGVVSNSSDSDITLAKVAKTGKIVDTTQSAINPSTGNCTDEDMLIFDCGTSTINTLTT